MEMPPVSSRQAYDVELALMYQWLDGVEAVQIPFPVTLTVEALRVTTGGGPAEVTLTAQAADMSNIRYRILLEAELGDPVAYQMIEYRLSEDGDWSTFTTDDLGEATLGPDDGFVLVDAQPVQLRVALELGKTALVIEAVDFTSPDSPVVVGIGTAVLNIT